MGVAPAISLIVPFAAASFFFAVAETALFSLSPWQARRLAQQVPRLGGIVSEFLTQPEDLLATIVLGNTLANAGITGIAFWLCVQGGWPIAPVLIGAFFLILLGCEVMPKALAVRLPEIWALRVAGPLLWMQRVTRPFQWMGVQLNLWLLGRSPSRRSRETTDEDYRELIDLACQQGTLAESEKEIILQIIGLDQRIVKEVMKPRSQMACISDNLTIEEMIAAAIKFKFRRLPMYDEEADTIVGVLNTRTFLLDPQADLSEAIEFPSFVPDSMNLLKLWQSLQRQQRGMAIVMDEFGGTAGIVTIEDILEEVIGEIRGEGEEAGFLMEKLGEGRWRVNGAMRQEDFQREYPQLPLVPLVETMAGLMITLCERVPVSGETILHDHTRFTAMVADERRVKELLVEVVRKTGGTGP